MTTTGILVVEDEFVTATDIQTALAGMGYQVMATVDNGEEAIRKAGNLRPSLVLMDIGLAGRMTGIEAGKRIREIFDIPVVFLTAHADESTFWSALRSEPFGYVTKPFEHHDLKFAIEMALHKHGEAKGNGTGTSPSGRLHRALPVIVLIIGAAIAAGFLFSPWFHQPGGSAPGGLIPDLPGPTPAAVTAQAGGTQYERNVEAVSEIARVYHDTHTYLGVSTGQQEDIYACLDMSKDIWNQIKTRGINAMIAVGNVDRNITTLTDVDHAWVLAEVGPMQWLAVETTGGYVVTRGENPLYYTGKQFESPADLKEYQCGKGYCWTNTCVEDQCRECGAGTVLGPDLRCHPACGSTYCPGDSICSDGQCVTCKQGEVIGTDNRCHPACIDATHYCLAGYVCGADNRCHPA